MAGLALVPGTTVAGAESAAAAVSPPALSEQMLLSRLTDPATRLTPLPSGVTVSQVSSHDLSGGNLDGGSFSPVQAPVLPMTFVRRADGAYVLADQHGPGCLVRIWMTSSSGVQGNTSSFGNLQLFFDGSPTPAVDVPAARFFAGKDRRFPRPLVNDYVHSSGGNYSYIPFCFSRRLEIRATGKLATMANFFQLTFLNARPGTPVQTFHNGAGAAAAAAAELKSPGRQPEQAPRVTMIAKARPGNAIKVPTIRGSGVIRYLRVSVRPFDIANLRALRLQVAVDNPVHPQIDVPLAAVFGDGLEVRPIRTAAFGEDPKTRSGYLGLRIPYRRAAQISIASAGATAAVTISAWTARASHPDEHLFGRQAVTHTTLGRDFEVLQTSGSGRLASYVLDIRDATPLSGFGSAQWFMEGDERVYVDGLRSPSIYGTGTEDTFNGGYYYNHGAFTLPFNGAGPFGHGGATYSGTQSQYRVFGDDGPIWSDGIDYRQQAGGNDERLAETATVTTFSYRGSRQLFPTDQVDLSNAASRAAHRLTGQFTAHRLDSYFEGDRDGTIPVSTTVIGGSYYLSPLPENSPEGVTAQGIRFRGPVSATLQIPRHNRGVVLRRLQDQAKPEPVRVLVNGHVAGTWAGAQFQGNPLKRWLESDFELPRRLTSGRRQLRVTLRPANPWGTATAYSLQSLVRRR